MSRVDLIKQQLTEALNPSRLEIIDDSAKHIGHAGNTGGGHYTLNISSTKFVGLNKIQCHRLIYKVLGDLIPKEIHALSINIIEKEE